MSQEEGVIDPRTEFGVYLYFKARKALSVKKMIRLEVRGTMPCLAEQDRVISLVLLVRETVLEGKEWQKDEP